MSTLKETKERAWQSGGSSNSSFLYDKASQLAEQGLPLNGTLADVGCGRGALYRKLSGRFGRYLGIDVVRHPELPLEAQVEFLEANLDTPSPPLPKGQADVVCCLETIEHVENPRALMRTLAHLAKPAGTLIVSTPNQLSLLSKLCLMVKNEFVHFQELPGLYPAHLSPLLEIDLVRMARENRLTGIEIFFTGDGRIPLTSRHWPSWLASERGWRGRAFSDNVILRCVKPAATNE